MTSLNVGDLRVEQGRRETRVMSVPVDGRSVDVPVIAINGAHEGPRIAITGGIHGAEYVGIEAARRLGTEIDPAELAGSLVVVPIANTTAFFKRSIYTSGLDENNLNRMFPGNPQGDPSQVLATWLFENIIHPSHYYIDLHGGDMIEALVPFVIYLESENKQVEEASLAMARATGIPRIIRGVTPGSTYAAATAAGIPAILAEIGGQGLWSDQLAEQHKEGALRVLRHLGALPGGAPAAGNDQRLYDTFAWMRAGVGGLFHPSVQVGDMVRSGQPIGRITDYFGEELQRIEAVADGEIVFLVTSLAMNAGDPLLAIGA
jgi:predicted deacylase